MLGATRMSSLVDPRSGFAAIVFAFLLGCGNAVPLAIQTQEGMDSSIRVVQGKRVLWSAPTGSHAFYVRVRDTVVFQKDQVGADRGQALILTCRRARSGQIVWERGIWRDSLHGLWAGGDTIVAWGQGASRGHGIRTAADLIDILPSWRVIALEASTGRSRWDGPESIVGTPMWTDNRLLMTIRFTADGRTSQSPAVTLVLRDLQTGVSLESHRLTGVPGMDVSVRYAPTGTEVLMTGEPICELEDVPAVARVLVHTSIRGE